MQLLDTLIVGKKYLISFYVSLADSQKYACNNIGAYLSSTSINSFNNLVLTYTPQIENSISNPLTNKNGWTLISDTLIAVGGEKYITIGNFDNDSNSDTVFVGGPNCPSGIYTTYYYIDDIQVYISDSLNAVNEINKTKQMKIYPNPSNGVFQIQADSYQLIANGYVEIYNVMGECINQQIVKSPNQQIDLREAPNGIYFLQLKTSNGVAVKKVVISH